MILPCCLFILLSPLNFSGNDSAKSCRGKEYAHNDRRTVGRGVFCVVRVVIVGD
jgi:hypothetical protein